MAYNYYFALEGVQTELLSMTVCVHFHNLKRIRLIFTVFTARRYAKRDICRRRVLCVSVFLSLWYCITRRIIYFPQTEI